MNKSSILTRSCKITDLYWLKVAPTRMNYHSLGVIRHAYRDWEITCKLIWGEVKRYLATISTMGKGCIKRYLCSCTTKRARIYCHRKAVGVRSSIKDFESYMAVLLCVWQVFTRMSVNIYLRRLWGANRSRFGLWRGGWGRVHRL